MIKIKKTDWESKGRELYGDNVMDWKFRCPVCGHVATPQDYKNAGAPETTIAFSCVGRWTGAESSFDKTSPCNYAGGGLFLLNPILIIDEDGTEYSRFDFGGGELVAEGKERDR